MDLQRLERACQGKAESQGGLNVRELRLFLISKYPGQEFKLESYTRGQLEGFCQQVLPKLKQRVGIEVYLPQEEIEEQVQEGPSESLEEVVERFLKSNQSAAAAWASLPEDIQAMEIDILSERLRYASPEEIEQFRHLEGPKWREFAPRVIRLCKYLGTPNLSMPLKRRFTKSKLKLGLLS